MDANSSKSRRQDLPWRQRSVSWLLLGLLILSVIANIYLYDQDRQLQAQADDGQKALLALNSRNKQKINKNNVLKKHTLKYLTEDFLPRFPISHDIRMDLITNFYPYHINNSFGYSSGWLIEVAGQPFNEFYLVSDVVQVKLKDVMVPGLGASSKCTTDKVITTGNERSYGRKLKDKQGYMIISGIDCATYGGGDSIAVYSLSTGEKIKLKGDFQVRGSIFPGVTKLGTATGRLVGVFGIDKPKIVVSYGSNRKDSVEEIRQLAFFDLQTGALIRVENFN